MNDLERDLRALLEEKGAGAGVPMPQARLLHRARRRQLSTLLGGVLVAAAFVGASIVGVSALRSSDGATPAEPNRLVDTNVYGITITHPDGWYVVDPVEAGIEPPSEDLPRLVLWVSDTEPTPDTFACPGLGDRAGDGFVLTLQQTPLALTGEAARKWPVELSPMDVGTSASPCYPGWVFMRASWTSAGRTLEARVGMGAEVSEADRAALLATFASLRIAPTEIAPDALVIASGTAGGEDWELIAEDAPDGLGLTLQWPSGGVGIGVMEGVDDPVQLAARILGEGDERTVVVFGSARKPISRVDVLRAGGGPAVFVSADVLDVPDPIGGDLDAFVLAYEPEPGDPGATLNAYDTAGELVATDTVTPQPEWTDPGVHVDTGAEMAAGEGWTLRIDDGARLCLTIVVGDGSGGSCTDTDEFWMAEVITLQDRSVVYGLVRPETDRVVLQLDDGTAHEGRIIAPPEGFAYQVTVFAIELDGTGGTGRISVLDDSGGELGSADIQWAPGRSSVRYELPAA